MPISIYLCILQDLLRAFLQDGRSSYNRGGGGGGRRRGGGGAFRGGGRGNFGHHQPRPDGPAPHFRGRGRGRGGGGGRRFPQHTTSSSPHLANVPAEEPTSASEHQDVAHLTVEQGEAPHSAMAPGQAPLSAPTAGRVTSTRRTPQIAWCELCRVDCTSLEILEQHKNGKRHKKNLQRFEELQKAQNSLPMPPPALASTSVPAPTSVPVSVPEMQDQKSLLDTNSEVIAQPENLTGSEVNKLPDPENLTTEVSIDENKTETEQQNVSQEQHEVAEAEMTEAMGRKRRFERFDARRRGFNKKMRGGRGGRLMRMIPERPNRPIEPPKEVVPIICDLCNVKCDTQAVFDSHLAGKKHLSKLKRFQGHQAMYGSIGLQALYPPNPNTQPIFIPQVHQPAIYVPQGSLLQPVSYVPPPQAAPVAKQISETEGAEVSLSGNQNDVSVELEGQQVVGTNSKNGVSELEGMVYVPPSDNSALPTSENAVIESVHIVPATKDAVPVPEYGVTSSEHALLPGHDTKMEEITSKNEEST